MEEIKKKAIERFRQEKKEDYNRGYERAYEMVADGTIDLKEAQVLVNADEPHHDEFDEESEDFIEGFVDALSEILSEAKSGE